MPACVNKKHAPIPDMEILTPVDFIERLQN